MSDWNRKTIFEMRPRLPSNYNAHPCLTICLLGFSRAKWLVLVAEEEKKQSVTETVETAC